MSLPERFNCQTILWVHHKISPKVVKHNSIRSTVELKQNKKKKKHHQDKQTDHGGLLQNYSNNKPENSTRYWLQFGMSDSYSLQFSLTYTTCSIVNLGYIQYNPTNIKHLLSLFQLSNFSPDKNVNFAVSRIWKSMAMTTMIEQTYFTQLYYLLCIMKIYGIVHTSGNWAQIKPSGLQSKTPREAVWTVIIAKWSRHAVIL